MKWLFAYRTIVTVLIAKRIPGDTDYTGERKTTAERNLFNFTRPFNLSRPDATMAAPMEFRRK